jgi:hypothetical protein
MTLAAFALSSLLALAAPTVTTGPAESITTGSAVVTGTVNPEGEATTYRVEYSQDTSFALSSPDFEAGDGSAGVDVRVTLTGLTPGTTYRYRLAATNASGTVRGAERTFTTAPAPRAPTVTTLSSLSGGANARTLRARVNPRGLATVVYLEYGTTTSYGSRTPDQAIGSGSSNVTVSAPIAGLRPNTRYYYRPVASSAAGITRGSRRSFTTARAPTGVTVTPGSARLTWGTTLRLTGTVAGDTRTPVALQKQDHPYTGPFVQVATATANASGRFTLTSPPLFTTARLRVVTRTSVVAASPLIRASVAVKVGLRSQRLRGRRVRFTGATWPAIPNGRVSLQRQTASGRWALVKRARPTALPNNRSRYRITIKRPKRLTNYRVVAVARDGGAHVPGTSRTVAIRR